MKSCIISFATKDMDYQGGIKRLQKSLQRIKFKGDFIGWTQSYPEGCPTHMNAPFAFKPFCFIEARKRGYDLILWIDSSGVVLRKIDPIFKMIENDGYAFFRNASYILGQWCSDDALTSFGISRKEALEIPEANAAAVGLNMQSQIAQEFLNKWYEKSIDGLTFRGVKEKLRDSEDYRAVKHNLGNRVSSHPLVRGHRHDQSALGIIASQLGMKLSNRHIVTSGCPFRRKTIIYIDRAVKVKTKALNLFYFINILAIQPLLKCLRQTKR